MHWGALVFKQENGFTIHNIQRGSQFQKIHKHDTGVENPDLDG